MPVGEALPLTMPPHGPRAAARRGSDQKSRLRRSISRWANTSDQEARDLRDTYADDGRRLDRATRPTASGSGCAARCAR